MGQAGQVGHSISTALWVYIFNFIPTCLSEYLWFIQYLTSIISVTLQTETIFFFKSLMEPISKYQVKCNLILIYIFLIVCNT